MEMKRIAMGNATESHLLIDHSKFQKRGFLKMCDAAGFTSIVTDDVPNDLTSLENIVNLMNVMNQ